MKSYTIKKVITVQSGSWVFAYFFMAAIDFDINQ